MVYLRGLGHFCIILALLLFSACSDPEKKKQEHYAKAMEYIQNDDSKSAAIELRNAIQLDPKFADARYQLALIHMQNGDMREAFGQLKRTADLDPSNLDAQIKVTQFLILAKNTEEGRKYAEQILQTDPTNADGLVALANIELLDGNYEAALAALDKVPGDMAETDQIYNLRGRIHLAMKDLEKAEAMLVKALDTGPGNLGNYQTLIMLYQQQKRLDDAGSIIQKAVAAFPEIPQVYLLQANYYNMAGNEKMAGEAALKALELEPTNESLYLMIAGFYKKQGEFAKAADFLKDAQEKLPDSTAIKAALADYYFELRQFDKARNTIDAILATNPAHGGATFVNAKLLLKDNKVKEAIDLLTSLTTNYPKWADPFYFLSLAHLRLGEQELAGKAIGEALQLVPADTRFHTLQAQIYLLQGDATGAEREAATALQIQPRNFAAAKLLSQALLQEKQYEKAIRLISQIREQVPTDKDLLGNLGLAHMGMKQMEEAKQDFRLLLEIDPGNTKALVLLTNLTAQGDIKNAIDIVQKQIIRAPESDGHYLLLGELYLRDKQPEMAIEALAKAQSLAPDNPQPYIIRARLMHSLGRTDEAVGEFQQLLEKQPDSVPGRMGIATLYEAQNKFAEAREEYRKVLEKTPDQAVAANNLAYLTVQEENGDLGEALRLAMLAKQAMPDDPHIADTLGLVHYKRDAYGLAIFQFQQALVNRPEDPIINYHLALAQFANNDKEEARLSVEKALASKTAFAEREEAEKLLQNIQQN